MPPTSASFGEMSLFGQGISKAELDANAVGASELNNSECANGQIWKRAGGAWGCGADNSGSGGLGYALQGITASGNPFDSTTTFFGSMTRQPGTVAGLNRIYIPLAGNITLFRLFVNVGGTLGSGETVEHFIRLNDTTDNLQLDFAYSTSTPSGATTGSVAVVAGDFIEVKVINPAWGTNPMNVRWAAVILIE